MNTFTSDHKKKKTRVSMEQSPVLYRSRFDLGHEALEQNTSSIIQYIFNSVALRNVPIVRRRGPPPPHPKEFLPVNITNFNESLTK